MVAAGEGVKVARRWPSCELQCTTSALSEMEVRYVSFADQSSQWKPQAANFSKWEHHEALHLTLPSNPSISGVGIYITESSIQQLRKQGMCHKAPTRDAHCRDINAATIHSPSPPQLQFDKPCPSSSVQYTSYDSHDTMHRSFSAVLEALPKQLTHSSPVERTTQTQRMLPHLA